jgi:hypothetical protein
MCKLPFQLLTLAQLEEVKLKLEIIDLRNKNKKEEVKSQRDVVPAYVNDLLDFSCIKLKWEEKTGLCVYLLVFISFNFWRLMSI